MTTHYHLAEANVARLRFPLTDARAAEFVEMLAPVNALADGWPGFVWRLQTEAGDATGVRAYDDELMLFNMSVWESLDALRTYTYRGDHAKVLRARGRWFLPSDGPSYVLFWVPAGQVPSVEEGTECLRLLRDHGPCPQAFVFKRPFDPPPASPAPGGAA